MYRALPKELHDTADKAKAWFASHRGVRDFKIEPSIDDEIEYCPTLVGRDGEQHLVCLEIRDSPFNLTDALNSFILDCIRRSLPVKLYLVMPIESELEGTELQRRLVRISKLGVGYVIVDGGRVHVQQEAFSLSLMGLREVPEASFPRKFRLQVGQGVQTFRSGNPSKACSEIYDILESVTRSIANKANKNGLLRDGKPIPNVDKMNWKPLVQKLRAQFDGKRAGCPKLNESLFTQIETQTGPRNDTNHRPRTMAQLKKRDEQLRTRFETARDLLLETVTAASKLRI